MTGGAEMSRTKLNLVVLRSQDPERSVQFYRLLGLTFERHRHGHGPEHFAAVLGTTVLEIYRARHERDSTAATRLGFEVPCVDSVVAQADRFGARIVKEPGESEWGRRAVIEDPDGHQIELLQNSPAEGRLDAPAE
jgi:predicted enzyme related to lactoylglutathione lyase